MEPSIIEFARNQDPKQEGGLYGLLAARPTFSLHYNKDVFDMLGVDYPTDDMTWEEVIELAKDLTREMNGVQYRGSDLDVPYDAYTQFSEISINPETDEVLKESSEAYRRYLDMIDDTISIPGNYPAEFLNNWGALFGEGNIAMAPAKTHHCWLGDDSIDIVTYPTWEGYEGIDPSPNGNAYAITEPSEHEEVALEIIDYLLSDEVQMIKSREGIASPLSNPDIHEVYNSDIPELEDINLESLFMHGYATGVTKKPKYGDGVIDSAGIDFANSNKDLNEFLRIIQEEAEENIRAQMESE